MAVRRDCKINRVTKYSMFVIVIVTLAESISPSAQSITFSPRLMAPRIAPVPEQERTETQQQMLASRPDFNIYKTLAHHPELFARWSGLGRFLMNGSSLPPRHREMLMLR